MLTITNPETVATIAKLETEISDVFKNQRQWRQQRRQRRQRRR